MRILSLAAVAFYLALTALTQQALKRAGAPTVAQSTSWVAER